MLGSTLWASSQTVVCTSGEMYLTLTMSVNDRGEPALVRAAWDNPDWGGDGDHDVRLDNVVYQVTKYGAEALVKNDEIPDANAVYQCNN
jgi:hypothetical protein